ncbi:MAG: minichromosome maintenance protein MCM [Candidatus Aenigmatarchaeota archaeon]
MDREVIIEKFLEFLNEFYKQELMQAISEGKQSIAIDFSLLDRFDVELANYLLENPDEVISYAGEAVEQLDLGLGEAELTLRFYNLPESNHIRIRNLRAEHIKKMIVVEGIVKRASEVRPEVAEAIFQCPECDNQITVIQTERTISGPVVCDSCKNKKGFKLVGQKLYDARWIVIEEPFEITSGERPSEIMVYLKKDLTSPRMQNKTDPGNRIKVVGILKELPRRLKGTRSRQMEIYLEANHVEAVETEWEELEITPEDEAKIIELSKDPEIYVKFVNSIAPAIYGMEEVKEAILLQLFGGEPKILPDGTRVRGDIHTLLIGDPSTAKSALMKVVSTLIPRGRYVSGKGVTGAGLTATVVRDEEFLGGWVLEAGALVLCNKSLCAIDEFEKIEKTDLTAMHEAMEQQTISIAKANIVATLPAQTAILGGGNPKLGRFDPYIPIKEQIDIPETILARFDLKFAIRDIPNPEIDEKIADHILKVRHFEGEEAKPIIDHELLKKYVSYARKKVHPKLTREAAEAIKNFYLDLRSKSGEESAIAITPRQYEALIRLAEASAKVQLRNEVLIEDAMRAIRLMKASLREFGFEPATGQLDIDRAEGRRITAAQRSRIRMVMDIIDKLTEELGKEIPFDEVLRRAREQAIENPDEIIRKMLSEGMLIAPKPGFLQKI